MSNQLLNKCLIVRIKGYGWCKGTIISKIKDRRRMIGQECMNFLAKFDVDQGQTTDLSLEAAMYDTSPSADYESWLLLEEELQDGRSRCDNTSGTQKNRLMTVSTIIRHASCFDQTHSIPITSSAEF